MTADDLVEIEQIKQLKARYFLLMDQKRWSEWADVFCVDCTIDTTQDDSPIHPQSPGLRRLPAPDPRGREDLPSRPHPDRRADEPDDRHRHLGDGGHALVSGGQSAPDTLGCRLVLRALPQGLRRQVADPRAEAASHPRRGRRSGALRTRRARTRKSLGGTGNGSTRRNRDRGEGRRSHDGDAAGCDRRSGGHPRAGGRRRGGGHTETPRSARRGRAPRRAFLSCIAGPRSDATARGASSTSRS